MYQAGKENITMVMVVVLNILIQEQLQKISKFLSGSDFTMRGAWTTSCRPCREGRR